MGAMLEMMQQMMGNKPGPKPAEGKNPAETQQGGQGVKKASNSANTKNSGKTNTESKEGRRVPRAAGKSGTKLPAEFQKALDGYNKKAQAK